MVYGEPPDIPERSPIKTNIVDRVTINELILNLVIIRPLSSPAANPKSNTRGTVSQALRPKFWKQIPMMTVAILPMAPTDIFIPPTTRQTASASATNMLKAIWRDSTNTVYELKKVCETDAVRPESRIV